MNGGTTRSLNISRPWWEDNRISAPGGEGTIEGKDTPSIVTSQGSQIRVSHLPVPTDSQQADVAVGQDIGPEAPTGWLCTLSKDS